MQAQDICFCKKLFAAFWDFETSGSGPAGGPFPPPTTDARAECLADSGHDATDLAVGVNAQRFSVHADSERRLPMALFESIHFERKISQRAQDQSPSQLSGRIRIARTARGDNNALLRARIQIDVCRRPSGLSDKLELGQFFDQCPRKISPLLREHDGVGIL